MTNYKHKQTEIVFPLGLEPNNIAEPEPTPAADNIVYESDKNKPKGDAWKVHRKLKEEKMVQYVSIDQVVEICKKFDNLRDRCFFILMYLTGGRVGELCRITKRRYGKKKVKMIYDVSMKKAETKYIQDHKNIKLGDTLPGIKRGQIDKTEIDGKPILRIRLRNNKNKTDKSKILPIPLEAEKYPAYKEMFKIVRNYANSITDEDEELFPFGERRAEQIIGKIKWNPHTIRSLRATHLVRYHNFTDQKLVAFMGWSDSRPAKAYVKLSFEDMARSLLE